MYGKYNSEGEHAANRSIRSGVDSLYFGCGSYDFN